MLSSSCLEESLGKVAIVPVGEVEAEVLDFLRRALEEVFVLPFETGKGLDELEFAYNPGRGQYHSTPILTRLSHLEGMKEFEKVLGVADVDLYVPRLNFVFGEALGLGGKFAVVSLTRLRQEFYGLAPERELFGQRALKEAVHELGHLYDLVHCDNPDCVMHFSNSLADTDRKGPSFCPGCRSRLKSSRTGQR